MFAHQEWLGFVQPVGLVVSPNVMADAQVVPDRNVSGRQREFRELLEEDGRGVAARWRAPDIRRVLVDWLGWEPDDLQDAAEHRDALEVALPELQTVLSPTWAVPEDDVGEPDPPEVRETRAHYDAGSRSGRQEAGWSMLVSVEDGADLDSAPEAAAWNATRHARFERLLRETGVPVGLLCTDECVRLVYAPEGESSGHLTFDFSQMALPAGRPILSAFEMLLSAEMLFGGAAEARLGTLLAKSREAQAEVSTRLSRQVLAALHELLRGFVAAEARGAGFVTDLARRESGASLRRTHHNPDAARVRALRGRPGVDARPSGLPAALLLERTVRPLACRCGCVARHHGPAVRCLGAAPCAIPVDPRRWRARRTLVRGP